MNLSRLLSLGLLSAMVLPLSVQAEEWPTVTVSATRDAAYVGTPVTISWETTGFDAGSTVDVAAIVTTAKGVSFVEIASDISNAHQYIWTVPSKWPTAQVVFQVAAGNSSVAMSIDQSDEPLIIVNPEGGPPAAVCNCEVPVHPHSGKIWRDQLTGTVYMIDDLGYRRPIASDEILETWTTSAVRMVSPRALRKYPLWKPMPPAPGAIVHFASDRALYEVVDGSYGPELRSLPSRTIDGVRVDFDETLELPVTMRGFIR